MLCFLLCKKQRCCSYILLVLNIFLWKMYAEHFPLENVQHHILLCKMFSITFYFVKCSAKQNVTNAFDAKMHLMLPLHFVYKMLESGKMHFGNATQRCALQKFIFGIKCFLCKIDFLQRIKCIFASNAFLHS